jgi:hypothetical protein
LKLKSKNVQNENVILEKYKKLEMNFRKKFFNLIKMKSNNIKDFIPELIKKSENFVNDFFDCFNKSYLIKINQIKNIKNKDIENEINLNLITKLDELNKLFQNNIEEDNMVINLKEYSIKVIEDNEDQNNQKWEELSNRDICFIVKTIYNNFKIINKSKYNVDFEERHINLKAIIDKLFSYGYLKNDNLEKKADNNNHNEFWKFLNIDLKEFSKMLKKETKEVNKTDMEEKISPKEVDYLCESMEVLEHREYFLLRLNNFRTLGEYNMPLDIFDYMVKVFLLISKKLFNESEKDEKKLDFKNTQLLIILSQTFYCMKNEEKIYLYKDLSKEELFHKEEFWNILIKLRIDSEIELVKNNEQKEILSKDLEKSVVFSQLLSLVTAMNDLGNNKDYIKNIMMPFINQYNIDKNNLEIINNLIENQK